MCDRAASVVACREEKAREARGAPGFFEEQIESPEGHWRQ
jgi:hypothetical protein